MAGKLCTGSRDNNAGNLKNSRAFCEGRTARGAGALIDGSPHEAGSEADKAWNHGWFMVDQVSPSYVDEFACCSAVGDVTGTPAVVKARWEGSIPEVVSAQLDPWTIDMNDYILFGTAPFTFAVNTGAPPAGITLNADGTFAGTVTNAGGAGDLTVIATNSAGDSLPSPTLHWSIV